MASDSICAVVDDASSDCVPVSCDPLMVVGVPVSCDLLMVVSSVSCNPLMIVCVPISCDPLIVEGGTYLYSDNALSNTVTSSEYFLSALRHSTNARNSPLGWF